MNSKNIAIAIAVAALSKTTSNAQTVYSDSFSSAGDAANYNTFVTAGSTGPSSDATFGYDYSALGIPSAPNTTDGSTLGLRLRVDNLQTSVSTTVGAVEVVTKNLTLPSQYVFSVDVWGNYIGGTSIAASGSNGSTGAAVGIGTAGTSLQYIAGNDGLLVEAFHDNGGGVNNEYRVYTGNTHPTPATSSYYAAGTSATSASYTDPYYSFLGSHTAPAAQISLSAATQGGSTPVGIIGFAWHTMTVVQNGTTMTWAIDGHTIATVPDSAVTLAGNQISLGADDSGLAGNSTAINQLLNADIWDNALLVAMPEPSTYALAALGAAGLYIARRRQKS